MEVTPEDIAVNTMDLYGDYERQSSLYLKVTSDYAIARRRAIILEEELSILKKEMKISIDAQKGKTEIFIKRSDPSDFDLQKFTDSTVNALVASDSETVILAEDYLKKIEATSKKYALAVQSEEELKGMKEALQHKKDSLSDLIRGWQQGFYQPNDDISDSIPRSVITKEEE